MWKHYSRDVQKKQPRIPELVLILATAPRYRVLHIQTENTQLGSGLRETGSDSAKIPLTVQIFEHNKKARRTGMVRLALQMVEMGGVEPPSESA